MRPPVKRFEDTVDALVGLGLTPAEAHVYVALLRRPGARVVEIAQTAAVSRSRAYTAVRALVDRGLVEERPGVFKRFQALEPDAAVGALERAEHARVEACAKRVLANGSPPVPVDAPSVAPEQALSVRFVAGATRDVLALVRADDFLGNGALTRMPVPAGVRVRVVLERDAPNPFRHVASAECRVAEVLHASLLVVDASVAVLSTPRNGSSSIGTPTVAESPGVAAFLARLFDSVWQQAAVAPDVTPV